MNKYQKWIADYVAKHATEHWPLTGSCQRTSKCMAKEFPELILCRGYYNGHTHWWLKTVDGDIYDPTIVQFARYDYKEHEYEEYHGPDPIGKCYNCGEWVWTTEFHGLCCEECKIACRAEFAQYCS